MTETVAAHTPSTGYDAYPPYFNVTRDGDDVVVTVRGHETETEGVAVCGRTCHPGGDNCNNYCRHFPFGYVPVEPMSLTYTKCGDSASMRMPYQVFLGLVGKLIEVK